ncbi:MAG TPA: HEAT repeat domain-containing protein [Spirochaetota bacterium]|nr:HEAT repeat domain-containing protein [Spirochaetota bacterium]
MKQFIISVLILMIFAQAQIGEDDYRSTNRLDPDYIKNLPNTPEVIDALEYSLAKGNDKVKLKVIDAFLSMGSKETAKILNKYLGYDYEFGVINGDPNESYAHRIRAKCAYAIGKLYKGSKNSDEGKQICARLLYALDREENMIAKKAMIRALGNIQCTDAVKPFEEMLLIEDESSLIFSMVLALGNIADKTCLKSLLKIREGNYLPSTKRAAQIAIQKVTVR